MRNLNRREWLGVAGMLGASPFLNAQEFNERTVEPRLHRDDKNDIWTLNFRFKDPRVITADVPGRGKKVIWYMWYQVYNKTGSPREFIPQFELVTLDKNTVHGDEVLPSVEEQIRRIEDPNNRQDIKNSVTIMKNPIPVTNPDSYPRVVTGLAIWSDIYEGAKDTNRFSIFVTGLSNGWTIDDNKVIRRKTLQLNFAKVGDHKQDLIRYADNSPPEWRYRATAKIEPKVEGAGKVDPQAVPPKEPLKK